jgi:hypothetical protein
LFRFQSERRELNDDFLEREFDEELYERELFRSMAKAGARKMFQGGNHHRHGSASPLSMSFFLYLPVVD